MFDPEELLNQSVAGEISTDYNKVPPGEYAAIVGDKMKITNPKDSIILKVPFILSDEALASQMGRKTSQVSYDVFLEYDEAGKLKVGKGENVKLGLLRESLGQKEVSPWKFTDMIGRPARITVAHSMYNGEIYEGITKVVPLG